MNEEMKHQRDLLDYVIAMFERGEFTWVDHEATDGEREQGCRCLLQAIYDEGHPSPVMTCSQLTKTIEASQDIGQNRLAVWNDTQGGNQHRVVLMLKSVRAREFKEDE